MVFFRLNLREIISNLNRKAVWRYKPATQKQIDLLIKFGIPVPHGIKMGKAGTLITRRLHGALAGEKLEKMQEKIKAKENEMMSRNSFK
jgi:hypothetical protein